MIVIVEILTGEWVPHQMLLEKMTAGGRSLHAKLLPPAIIFARTSWFSQHHEPGYLPTGNVQPTAHCHSRITEWERFSSCRFKLRQCPGASNVTLGPSSRAVPSSVGHHSTGLQSCVCLLSLSLYFSLSLSLSLTFPPALRTN
jgi:hypothetical protein